MTTRYLVQNENTLGHTYPEQPASLWILASIVHPKTGQGPDWRQGSTYLDLDRCRPATLQDFERFRVDPRGHIAPLSETTSNPNWGMF